MSGGTLSSQQLVLDDITWVGCHELLADLRREHWSEATLADSLATNCSIVARCQRSLHALYALNITRVPEDVRAFRHPGTLIERAIQRKGLGVV